MSIVDKIIDKAGGVCALAGSLGIHHSSVILWRKNGKVPFKRIAKIEEVTGISKEEILADLFKKTNSSEAA